ncbi:hypothetical protein ZWY2020_040417 [Hordeum vulgare]|nr:hypothetical protein ZWY2020_040417 [Hordeum vulgare]
MGAPVQNRWCYSTERMQKMLRAKCKNKRRIEASMAEAFITEETANFVTAHYEAKNHHLHNPNPRYNDGDPKKVRSNLRLFKVDTSPNSRMERSSKRIPSKSMSFSQSMEADAESMDAELRQVANGFDYKVLKDGWKGSKALRGSFFVGG